MYAARQSADLTKMAGVIADSGIVVTNDIYSVSELAEINAAMEPIFKSKQQEKRAYVMPDEMLTAGILDKVLSKKMLNTILSIMPDPVLYHFHAYEIAGNSKQSHIFADTLGGWHRDPDSEFHPGDPTHISIFVYLSNVGERDGAFEFSPQRPDAVLRSRSAAVSMYGTSGLSFAWHRSFYHRAAPNQGSMRRRLLKLSIQRNEFPSAHLKNDAFRRIAADVPSGDQVMDLLLGRYQKQTAPKLKPREEIRFRGINANGTLNMPEEALVKLKRQEAAAVGMPVAYD